MSPTSYQAAPPRNRLVVLSPTQGAHYRDEVGGWQGEIENKSKIKLKAYF